MDHQKVATVAQVLAVPPAFYCAYVAWVQLRGPVPAGDGALNAAPFWIALGIFLGLAVLGTVMGVIQIRKGRQRSVQRPIKIGTFSTNLVTTTGKEFFNETVILDGRQFDRCKFVNCRLEYHATGNCNFIKCEFEGQYLVISPDEPCHVLFHIMTQLKAQSSGLTVWSQQNQRTGKIEPKAFG